MTLFSHFFLHSQCQQIKIHHIYYSFTNFIKSYLGTLCSSGIDLMELVLLSMLLLVLLVLLLFGENFTKSYLWAHNLTHIIKSWLVVATMEI